jgi:hypothetical protein
MKQKELQLAAELIWDNLSGSFLREYEDDEISNGENLYGRSIFIDSFVNEGLENKKIYLYVCSDDPTIKVDSASYINEEAAEVGMGLFEYESKFMEEYGEDDTEIYDKLQELGITVLIMLDI